MRLNIRVFKSVEGDFKNTTLLHISNNEHNTVYKKNYTDSTMFAYMEYSIKLYIQQFI